MRWFFMLLIAVLFALAVYMSYYMKRKSAIPCTIWTYWHDTKEMPKILQKCIDTWQANNPEYKINILDNDRIKKMFSAIDIRMMFPNITMQHARITEYARVLVLLRFGGIWLDPSMICTQSLDWVHKIHKGTRSEIVGFYSSKNSNKKFPLIENWFLSCMPNSPFLQDWLSEIRFMSSFDNKEQYIRYIKQQNIYTHGLQKEQIVQLCASVVHQKNPWKYKVHLTDSLLGPLRYLEENSWDLQRSFDALCKDKSLQEPILRMVEREWKYIEANPVKCESENPHIRYILNSDGNYSNS